MSVKNIIDKLKTLTAKDKKEAEASEDRQARIVVRTNEYQTSVMIVDENGDSHRMPVPDPVEEEFLVKKGDRINGFEVTEITERFLVLKSFMEYTEGNESTPKTQFIVEKGSGIDLTLYGLCDAVHKTSIEYPEPAEQKEEETDTERSREEYTVTKADWETQPMPRKNTKFTIRKKFTEEDLNRLKKGHLPEEMEDRWFFYYEDGKVYFHRSWSGNCIFIVEINSKTDKHTVTVNRDPDQYSNTDLNEDRETVAYLLS